MSIEMSKMQSLLKSLFWLILLPKLSSLLASTVLKCSHEEIIQFHKQAQLKICRTTTSTINIKHAEVSLSKHLCKKSFLTRSINSQPKLQISNTSVIIVFKNVSWIDSGLYSLNVSLSDGQVQKEEILIKVADVPVLPLQSISYGLCNGIDSFCFKLPLPSKHQCSANMTDHYWFNYTSYSMDYIHKNPIPCNIAMMNKERTLICKDDGLNVCKNKTLKDYFLHVQIFGKNKLGSSKSLHLSINAGVTAPEKSLIVKVVKIISLSPYELEFIWSRPVCKEIEIIYKVTYIADGSNQTQSKSYDFPDSSENNWRKDTLKGLIPFTNYTVCVFSMRYYGDVDYKKGACAINSTSQAAPSKPPVIVSTVSQNTGNGKWKCIVRWKGTEKKFWNGIIKNTKIELFDKTHLLLRDPVIIPVDRTEFEIQDLDISKEYFIKLAVCNKGGCIATKPKEISIEKADEKEKLEKIILGVTVFLLVAAFLVLWLFKRRKRNPVPQRRVSESNSIRTLSEIHLIAPRFEPHYDIVQDEIVAYDNFSLQREIHNDNTNEVFRPQWQEDSSHMTSSDSNVGTAHGNTFDSPTSEYDGDEESVQTNIETSEIYNQDMLDSDPLMLNIFPRV